MIHNVTINNLYSFENEVSINFSSGMNVIYGKNNSGKTNLLKVIKIWNDAFNGQFQYNPQYMCKSTNETYFGVALTFEYKKQLYEYSFLYDNVKQSFISERFKNITKNVVIIKSEFVINACKLQNKNGLSSKVLKQGMMSFIIPELIKDAAAITKIQQAFQINELVDNRLIINDDPKLQKQLLKSVKQLDLGIINIYSQNQDIIIEHSNYVTSVNEESVGTQKIINVLANLIYKKPNVLVIDMLETNIHEAVLKSLIKTVQKTKLQIISPTHQTIYLDEKLLPKENIHILNQDKTTEFYSLRNYPDLRNTTRHNWKNFYESGKFGGIPHT